MSIYYQSYESYMWWKYASINPEMMYILKNNIERIDTFSLNRNPRCSEILINYPELIIPRILEYNKNNTAVYMTYPELITWNAIKQNPKLAKFVETNINNIQW